MNRIEAAEKNMKKWLGEQNFCSGYADAEFESIAGRFLFGEVIERSALTDRQRAFAVLAALTACGAPETVERYAGAAVKTGVSAGEIREALIQCTPYTGVEKVNQALRAAYQAFEKAGVSGDIFYNGTVDEKTRFSQGLKVQQRIFGSENINAMRQAAPPELKHIQDYLSAYCFGDFYTRGALDLKDRELVTFCAICALGGCEPQAKSHAAANISVGNTRETLIEAVTQCLPFIGFPRTLNAVACIDAAAK